MPYAVQLECTENYDVFSQDSPPLKISAGMNFTVFVCAP